MGKIVPIRFVDRAGNPVLPTTRNGSNVIPVMDVIVRFEPRSPPQPVQADEITRLALVDTGADVNACTAELLAAIGAPPVRPITLAGVTSTTRSMRHYCHLLFPTANIRVEVDIDVAPLRDQGHCYDLIIGRQTLCGGILVMDWPGRRFYWDMHER